MSLKKFPTILDWDLKEKYISNNVLHYCRYFFVCWHQEFTLLMTDFTWFTILNLYRLRVPISQGKTIDPTTISFI